MLAWSNPSRLRQSRAARVSRRSVPRHRLGIESLEDRLLLATFDVTTTADTVDANVGDGLARDVNGETSLRQQSWRPMPPWMRTRFKFRRESMR